jgi:hypothetical protein
MPFVTKGGSSSSPFTGLLGYITGKNGASAFGASSTAEQVAANYDGSGKTVFITGANTGEDTDACDPAAACER